MRTRLLLCFIALSALLALGCDRAADLIPGSDEDPAATSGEADRTNSPVLTATSMRISGATDDASASQSGPSDAELARSIVQVRVLDAARIPPVVRDGSGVIIDRDLGLVLTSAHVVSPYNADGSLAYSAIQIATNPVPGGEPRLTHAASLIALDPVAELAVLRIDELLATDGGDDADEAGDGENTGGPLLDLPAVAIGDSTPLSRGDSVRMFGHPGLDPSGAITPQAVMVTNASVTGVRSAPAVGERAWLKTDARLPHGSGGGPVFGPDGELVGVASQIAYSSAAPVAHVRPIELAGALIERARAVVEEKAPDAAPLMFPGRIPGTSLPSPGDRVAISQPRFALEAIDEGGERELFDYGQLFPSGTNELHYEFIAQGVPNGATVQELWYLDGVFQDDLSATYNWELGPFALITDQLISPNPVGLPDGVWTFEVWTDGNLRAAAQAYLGVAPPEPTLRGLAFGSAVSATFGPAAAPAEGDEEVLAFFEYAGAGVAQTMSWRVYRGGALAYESPTVPWLGGNSGNWWVGYRPAGGLGLGAWEFEIVVNGEPAARAGFEVTAAE